MTTTTSTVRIVGSRYGEFAAFVTLPGHPETRVRFRRRETGNQWTCDTCGPHRFATCPHETQARQHRQTHHPGDTP